MGFPIFPFVKIAGNPKIRDWFFAIGLFEPQKISSEGYSGSAASYLRRGIARSDG
jgi:hypothetical protein